MFVSRCPLKAQISQGLGPFFQIELLKTVRDVSATETMLAETMLADLRAQASNVANYDDYWYDENTF